MIKKALLFSLFFAIATLAADKDLKNLQDCFNKKLENIQENGCVDCEKTRVVRDDKLFKVLLEKSLSYCSPAAHGSYWEEVKMYRKSDGKLIEFDDIFMADTASILKIVNDNRKNALNENILGEPNNGMANSATEIHSVFLAPKGVGFTWHTYHVNNGAAGPITIILPYKYFKGVLRASFEDYASTKRK